MKRRKATKKQLERIRTGRLSVRQWPRTNEEGDFVMRYVPCCGGIIVNPGGDNFFKTPEEAMAAAREVQDHLKKEWAAEKVMAGA